MKPATLLLTAAVVVLNVLGNFALSWGMKHAPASAGPILSLLQPFVILGIVMLIAWTLLRIKLLGLADLSFVLPVTAVGYVLSAVMGAVFLHEHVSLQRWSGTLLIFAGAALTGLTPAETNGKPKP
ncbi:EamA family transporter [Paludibaculum fermentans]|uniref:EamA family transporter n=1 Tax=Paludibaculum fermentans TaxID=1473598 RepID=A0A7S7NNK7_PALFE|nr:EamA family transporter [Paludibaculum fermentans]QOY86937.1 EamA family transporter [Paludibaculum fermentans]